jgi:hypothetical protein
MRGTRIIAAGVILYDDRSGGGCGILHNIPHIMEVVEMFQFQGRIHDG